MEERVRQLERQVSELNARLAALEARRDAPGAPGSLGPPLALPEEAPSAPLLDLKRLAPVVAEVGQGLVVVGGAFLIRAVTDRGLVPPGLGVGLGIVFASVWIGVAWRRAAHGPTLGATFSGLTAVVIGYPLILESSTRLGLLAPTTAAVVLTAFTVALLAVAGQRRLGWVGWLGALASTATAVVLVGAARGSPFVFAAALVVVLGMTLGLADVVGWSGPRWVTALVADGVVTRGVFSAAALPETMDRVGPALGLCSLLLLLSLASATRRAFRPDALARLGAFEWIQVGLAIALGLGTAARARDVLPWVPPLAAGLALVVGIAAFIAAVRLAGRAEAVGAIRFHAGTGLELLLGGGALLTTGAAVASMWAAGAVGMAALGRRFRPTTLWLVAVALGLASAGAGGWLSVARDGLWARPEVPPHWPPLGAWAIPLLLLVAYRAMVAPRVEGGRLIRALRATLLGLLWLLGVGAVAAAARGVADGDGGLLALTRTLILVASAIVLAFASRFGAPPETGGLAWGALVAARLQLLVQDLSLGRPSTLFLAFVALGSGVLVLPRLVVRRGAAEARPSR